jgi:predicted site-specific integrase-resolvase
MLTAKDLEGLLQIDRKTIYSYAERGLIPYIRIESSLRFPNTGSCDGWKSAASSPER